MAGINDLISQAYAGIGRTDTGTGLGAVTQGEKDYWSGQVASGAITPDNFQSVFNNSVNSYKAANPNDPYTQYVNNYQAQQIPTGFSGNAYLAANPDVAAAYQTAPGGLNVDDFAKLHYSTYGINEGRTADANAIYNKLVTDAYGSTQGRTGIGTDISNIDQAGLDYWKNQLASGAIKPQDFGGVFGNAVNQYMTANPEDKYTKYVQGYQNTQKENTQIKDYISQVMADKSLTPWEQANKIFNQADANKIDQSRLETIYGKDKTKAALDTYRQGINTSITDILAKEQGATTTANELGLIHQYAQKNELTVDDLVKYGGMDKKAAQAYFDTYDKNLGTIVSSLMDPKTDDITKTKQILGLGSAWGATDAEIAKASKGKFTEKDIKTYLDPVRNAPSDLINMMNDNRYTAADVKTALETMRKDARITGVYGDKFVAALDTAAQQLPLFSLRDAQSGNKDLLSSYQDFLAQAKSTPESAAKYGKEIAAVQDILKKAQYSADDVFGGKIQDYQLQIMSSLTDKAKKAIPQKLEFGQPTQKTEINEDTGDKYTYTVPGKVKTPGVEVLEDGEGGIGGYRSTKPTNVNGSEVFAEYDEKGKLTGYSSNQKQATWLNNKQYLMGRWDANGNANPIGATSKGGGVIKNMIGDIASIGPVGSIILAAATGGLSSLATSYMGPMLAAAVAGGTMSYLGGAKDGDILKSALGAAAGQGVGSLVNSYMPAPGMDGGMGSAPFAGITGNALIDNYLTSAIPKGAGELTKAAISGKDVGQAGITSLLNTGVNMGTNSALNNLGLDTLPESLRPWASGIASNLITSSLTGKPTNLTNAATSTVLQQAMNPNKITARP